VKVSVTYNSGTGYFVGDIITNQCPYNYTGVIKGPTLSCVSQTIPDPAFPSSANPQRSPQFGRTALSLTYGVNIYGPLEAGFTENFVCTGGSCPTGVDLDACLLQLEYQCTTSIDYGLLPDVCGGHANPYHYHKDMACEYDNSVSSTHSPLIAISLDGRGIYGMWEGNGTKPDLDACNGHFGIVPVNTIYGVKSTCVYHYHTTTGVPFTMGCYGPVYSLGQCEALYSQCGVDYLNISTSSGNISYNQYCTCFNHKDPGSCPSSTTATSTTSAGNSEASTFMGGLIINFIILFVLMI